MHLPPGSLHKYTPFVCLNCDTKFSPPDPRQLYCSDCCQLEAELIRYVRRCRKDNGVNKPDVDEAINIKFAAILGGGYNKRARRIPPRIRSAVIARDNGQCRGCGRPGTEIDHIEGSSSALENLQLLCDTCHNKKTQLSIVYVLPGDEDYERLQAKRILVSARIEAKQPMRICDDDENWSRQWMRLARDATREKPRWPLSSEERDEDGCWGSSPN